ncbi:hypothetical protein ACFQWB_00910 [Paenibacillus thermoaerophilus]|uniref:Uncharacterized protein n=1 Tax=Paenibacillus thermoaerophilus TaxID=1215385 RepID=A0ABW2V116_9BACL|nr:hypothetical protein [Paenibacillus thermoaerophilus]TMV17369.1 hypothetical protein FE781_07740 [Paenibacillus thermoaerophilus]
MDHGRNVGYDGHVIDPDKTVDSKYWGTENVGWDGYVKDPWKPVDSRRHYVSDDDDSEFELPDWFTNIAAVGMAPFLLPLGLLIVSYLLTWFTDLLEPLMRFIRFPGLVWVAVSLVVTTNLRFLEKISGGETAGLFKSKRKTIAFLTGIVSFAACYALFDPSLSDWFDDFYWTHRERQEGFLEHFVWYVFIAFLNLTRILIPLAVYPALRLAVRPFRNRLYSVRVQTFLEKRIVKP